MKRNRKLTDIAAIRAVIEGLHVGIELEYEILESEPFSRPIRARIHARLRGLSSEIVRLERREAALLEEQERRAMRVWETESPRMEVTRTA